MYSSAGQKSVSIVHSPVSSSWLSSTWNFGGRSSRDLPPTFPLSSFFTHFTGGPSPLGLPLPEGHEGLKPERDGAEGAGPAPALGVRVGRPGLHRCRQRPRHARPQPDGGAAGGHWKVDPLDGHILALAREGQIQGEDGEFGVLRPEHALHPLAPVPELDPKVGDQRGRRSTDAVAPARPPLALRNRFLFTPSRPFKAPPSALPLAGASASNIRRQSLVASGEATTWEYSRHWSLVSGSRALSEMATRAPRGRP